MSYLVGSVLKFGAGELCGLENSFLESEIILGLIWEKERSFLRANSEKVLPEKVACEFFSKISLRQKGVPVAQIFGFKNWGGLQILVDENTLIPRDETEFLITEILPANTPKTSKNLPRRFLDLGCGSGCGAVFWAKNFPDFEVFASDICPRALAVARRNAEFHKTSISFRQSDLLEKWDENFEIVFANLPYLPDDFPVEKSLSFEPQKALFGGADGLDLIRRLENQIRAKKIFIQNLWLEFLPIQKAEIQKIFKDYSVKFFADVSGRDIFFARIQASRDA